ncbi:hypothetical protein DFH83_000652 [Clostridium saccharobutylicum]|nr:hypothetical protein [Clostridium saccharobutylicum]MBA8997275.1 hypothetical protein [Clostridium saccharobutylicum]NOV55137.1 hypothetical protein [Clostridium saccharobutylicum]NOV83361.1 hypothetical protein [Clostridium saccharobutylicum]NOW28433.1 hypothetical protein [Clostridium saccharobutylicum]
MNLVNDELLTKFADVEDVYGSIIVISIFL